MVDRARGRVSDDWRKSLYSRGAQTSDDKQEALSERVNASNVSWREYVGVSFESVYGTTMSGFTGRV